jgi:hypothetical protein
MSKTNETSAPGSAQKSEKPVSIHAKFKIPAMLWFKSGRFAPLNGPRGAESGDHL